MQPISQPLDITPSESETTNDGHPVITVAITESSDYTTTHMAASTTSPDIQKRDDSYPVITVTDSTKTATKRKVSTATPETQTTNGSHPFITISIVNLIIIFKSSSTVQKIQKNNSG